VRSKANLKLLNSTATSNPNVASGALVVAVDGASNDGELPCDAAGKCKLALRIPVKPEFLRAAAAAAAAAASSSRRLLSTVYDFKCVAMVGDVAFREEAAGGAFAVVGAPSADGAVTCETSKAGTYLLTAYPRTVDDGLDVDQTAETAFTAPAKTRPYALRMRFVGMSYADIMANSAQRAAFRAQLPPPIAAAAGLPAASVQVGALSAGSVVTEVTLHTPEDWTPEQVAAATNAILSNPAGIFSAAFLDSYGITGVEAALSDATPLPAAAGAAGGLSPGAQAGIAIGVIVAVLGASGGGYFAYKKRQQRAAAGQRPVFDNIGGAPAGGSYIPPPAGAGHV
jgi:hypothetical protein